GIVLALLYAFYIFLVSTFFPKTTPGLPLAAQTLREPETMKHPVILPVALLAAAGAAWLFVVRLGLFDWATLERLGASRSVSEIFWFVVLFGILTKPFIGIVRTTTLSLFLVVCLATAIAIYAMSYTHVKAGADYVVLTMGIAVAISFVIAVINRLI